MSKQRVCQMVLHICNWHRQENTSVTEINTAGIKELTEMDRPVNLLYMAPGLVLTHEAVQHIMVDKTQYCTASARWMPPAVTTDQ
jgi:hypothetical protein